MFNLHRTDYPELSFIHLLSVSSGEPIDPEDPKKGFFAGAGGGGLA